MNQKQLSSNSQNIELQAMLESLHLQLPQPKQFPKPTSHRYIMLHETLQNYYNPQQWSTISQHNSSAFLELQNKIYNDLINCEQLFYRYFHTFYGNHVRLYHWYLLAREKHHLIKPYIFKKLLRKSQDCHHDDMKDMQLRLARERDREKEREQKSKLQPVLEKIKTRRYRIDDLSNEIFNFMTTKSKTASLLVWDKPWSFKKHNRENSQEVEEVAASQTTRKGKRSKNREGEELLKRIDDNFNRHDFHELYIQTFHACDGPRYIFYDYEKHMKGLNQKDKYNTFIRGSNNKGKIMDLRLTQNSQQQPNLKQMKSCTADRMRTSYQYSQFGSATDEGFKKKSKVIFRRIRNRNTGKFIRK